MVLRGRLLTCGSGQAAAFERPLVARVDEELAAERVSKWVVVFAAVSHVRVTPPAFGVLKCAGHPAKPAAERLHRFQITVHALSGVEPLLLARVAGERGALAHLHAGGVDERTRRQAPAQSIAQRVRTGVVDRDGTRNRRTRRA